MMQSLKSFLVDVVVFVLLWVFQARHFIDFSPL